MSSIKRLSILSLVLMVASAVTAAILPAKKDVKNDGPIGTIRQSTGAGSTCVTTQNPDNQDCTVSATTDTSTEDAANTTSTDNAATSSSEQQGNGTTHI